MLRTAQAESFAGREAQNIKRITIDPTGTEPVSEQGGRELADPWNLWS